MLTAIKNTNKRNVSPESSSESSSVLESESSISAYKSSSHKFSKSPAENFLKVNNTDWAYLAFLGHDRSIK